MLGPGAYRLWSRWVSRKANRIEVFSTLNVRFEHELFDVLIGDSKLRDALEIVDLSDSQRALLWKDGRLEEILGPGRHAFWNKPRDLRVERFEIEDFRFEHKQLEAILAHRGASQYIESVAVDTRAEALLLRNGQLVERIGPGKYAFWKGVGRVRISMIDLREQSLDVSGQEIMTNDKVSLRLNLLVGFRVTDTVRAASTTVDYVQALYRESQLALRAAIGTRKLDDLLTDKESVGSDIRKALSERASEFGVEVRSVGLRDIILPGDMKLILNRVIEAEKSAQAELIRRREETAAARSQANTAKLLAENPILARLKELEMLKDVLAGTKATFVFGPEDMAGQVRSLVSAPDKDRS